MAVSAFIFDVENIFFDGTYWHRWVHQQATSLGSTRSFGSFLGDWRQKWLPQIYEGHREYWSALEDFLKEQALTECQVLELVISAKSRQRDVIRNSRPLPGIQSCLNSLKREGKKVAVICNSVHTSHDLSCRLTQIGIHVPLDICLTSRSAGRRLPDQQSFLELVSSLGVEASTAAYVSTSADRLAVAQLMGLRTVQIESPRSRIGMPPSPDDGPTVGLPTKRPDADFRVTRIEEICGLNGRGPLNSRTDETTAQVAI